MMYIGLFLSDTYRVRIRRYKNSRVWNRGKQLFHVLCISVDFPEPGKMLTYCFAIATWHLIGKIEIGL